MDPLSSHARRFVRPGALILAAAAVLAMPTAASAKTFVSHIPDPSGDAKNSSLDLTGARVAYNRRTGALSASFTVAGQIDTSKDVIFGVVLSNLENGKCTAPVMLVGGMMKAPGLGIGQLMNSSGVYGNAYAGKGSVDGDTFSVRVKNKKLAGKTVGCAMAMITSDDQSAAKEIVYDRTKGNDGFFG